MKPSVAILCNVLSKEITVKRKGIVLNKRAVQLGRYFLRKALKEMKKYSKDGYTFANLPDYKAKMADLKRAEVIGRNFM